MQNPTVCSVQDCDRDIRARGLCAGHYQRWRKLGDPGPAEFRTRAAIREVTSPAGPPCSVPVCSEPVYGRLEWCKAHHQRWLDKGTPGDTPVTKKRPSQGCKVDGCILPHAVKGYCRPHYRRWWNKGDAGGPTFVRPPTNPTYGAAHQRVKVARGPASAHPCPCGKRATAWAYQYNDPDVLVDPRGYLYSADAGCYAPMCTKCHRALDASQREKARRVRASAPGGLFW